ncbi:MAG: gamma-glutamyl-gamma-aminobutyrate hydrolase family protein [Pseudomonadota bacterium]|nr:gamma-glutamyl-gamma-aminobutyrate hydrolase family protein [Pseudomonadota bacterium]
MKKPIIGITMDEEEKQTYSQYPWYAARKNYAESIHIAGGVSIFLPNNLKAIKQYLSVIHGLVVTGGDFDIDPRIYGEKKVNPKVSTKKERTDFEIQMTKQALRNNLPVLGICGGQQLINVALGGSLIQHIPDTLVTNINHEQVNPRHEPSHYVSIKEGTLLFNIVKKPKMFVNSAHHQAVDKLGKNLIASAFSDDGIIEGIESNIFSYCLGIQWHPEFLIDERDINIFKSLINSAKLKIEKQTN